MEANSTFNALKEFLEVKMKQAHIYQPVMIGALLKRGGAATVEDIAKEILELDPTQIEYYADRVRGMVGRVLVSHGLVVRQGDSYALAEQGALSDTQRAELLKICELKKLDFLTSRGDALWEMRRRNRRPISGTVRAEVFARASFRCESCGASPDWRALEVDHILPKSLGGKDSIDNYQALCFSCNSGKGNRSRRDLRGRREIYAYREVGCLFCDIPNSSSDRVIAEHELAYAVRDAFPVSDLHTLVIPKRHISDYFGLEQPEVNVVTRMLRELQASIRKVDPSVRGFNIGMNCGADAGQTISHAHVHLIPRRPGDTENPRGGVRHVIPGMGNY